MMKFRSEDSGFCRVYYTDGNRILCYQAETRCNFSLYECTREGEPSHSIPHENYIERTPPSTEHTDIGREFNQWLKLQTH